MENKIAKICHKCGNAFHDNQPCVTNFTEFVWKYGGKEVCMIGSWSKWQVKIPMKQDQNNKENFYVSVNLAPGNYGYKFLVDGQWMIDLNAPHSKDPLGFEDNNIEVVPAIMEHSLRFDDIKQELDESPLSFANNEQTAVFVKITTTLEGTLKIKGSWDNWASLHPMKSKFYQALNLNESVSYLVLNPGIYEYKFFVNDTFYMNDSNKLSRSDNFGGFNNYFKVLDKQVPDASLAKMLNVEELTWSKIDVEELNFSAIQGHTINLIGEEFYIFGGFYHGKFLDTLRCVSKDNCQIEQPYTTGRIPEPRAYHNSIVYGDRLIIYGGLNEWEVFNNYYVLNTINKNWMRMETFGDKPSPRERCSLSNINDEFLVLFGGYNCSKDFEVQFYYNDVYTLNMSTLSWNKIMMKGELPDPRYGHTANVYKKKIYLFGGIIRKETEKESKCFNDIHVLNLIQNDNLAWEKLNIQGQLPPERYGHSAVIINHSLIIYGGRNMKGEPIEDVAVFDLKQNKWFFPTISGISPGKRCYHASLNLESTEMIVFGGYKSMAAERRNAIYSLNSGKTNINYTPYVPGTPKKKKIGVKKT